jgi:hypothetical protein
MRPPGGGAGGGGGVGVQLPPIHETVNAYSPTVEEVSAETTAVYVPV